MDRWDALIRQVLSSTWPELQDGVAWIEAQVQQESGGRPNARSNVGALGLLQLMPGTAIEMGLRADGQVDEREDPAKNLRAGIGYLRQQYEHLGEIPAHLDRLYWSFASYNGGRGYCNRALKLARIDELPSWWTWDLGRFYLLHRDCAVAGRLPDYRQMWGYVERIRMLKGRPA